MKLIPLHGIPVSGAPKIEDAMMIVNFDHVYCIERHQYWPEVSKDGVEGSRIHIATGEGRAIFDVVESRVTILRMLQNLSQITDNQKQNIP